MANLVNYQIIKNFIRIIKCYVHYFMLKYMINIIKIEFLKDL